MRVSHTQNYVTIEVPYITPKLQAFLDSCWVHVKNYDVRLQRYRFTPHCPYIVRAEQKYVKVILPDGLLTRLLTFLQNLQIPHTFQENNTFDHTPDWSVLDRFTLRAGQREAITAITTALEQVRGGYVVAPPAFGKTTILSLLCLLYPKAKIDIISRRRDVVVQIYQEIQKLTPHVGCITGGHKTKDRITVFTAGSLHYASFNADIIFLDEVHELVTEHYYTRLSQYTGRRIGFTATKIRDDNLHKRIEFLCGPELFEWTYQDAQSSGVVAPIAVIWYDVAGDELPDSLPPTERKRIGIWKNQARNQKIAEIAQSLANKDYKTLIIVETIQHALELKRLLPDFTVCYAGNSRQEEGDLTGYEFTRMSTKKRDEIRRKFKNNEIRQVIATGVWSTGVSFDDLQVLIRAEGTRSAVASIQVPGRVCRIASGKDFGVVIDFIDSFDKNLLSRAQTRFRWYKSSGWVQVDEYGRSLTSLRGKS